MGLPRARLTVGLVVGLIFGVAAGIGAFTFIYARGASYLTDDPEACANCHVMRDHFAGWTRSSHAAVAVCNDCHTPHGLIPKYWTKAVNGFWHSFAFTSGKFVDPIRIKPGNRDVAEAACRKCHAAIVHDIEGPKEDLSCLRCHRSVGHEVNR